MCAQSCQLWTIAPLAPLSMEFSKQEYWSRLPFPTPGDLPDPGIKTMSPASAGRFFTTVPPRKSNKKIFLKKKNQYPKTVRSSTVALAVHGPLSSSLSLLFLCWCWALGNCSLVTSGHGGSKGVWLSPQLAGGWAAAAQEAGQEAPGPAGMLCI